MATDNKKRILITTLYVITAFLASLASVDESRLGLVGSYLLWASVILLWVSKRRWSLWVPVAGSAVLVCYFVTADIRIFLKYSSALSAAYAVRTLAFLGLLVLTLVISLVRLRAASSDYKLGTAVG